MTDVDRDPILRRAVEELRRLPDASPERMARVVKAAAAARVAPADDDVLEGPPRRWRFGSAWSAAGLIAAAAFVGFVARGAWMSRVETDSSATVAAVAPPTVVATRAVSASASDVVALPQSFSLLDAKAHRVSVVGDFNNWNPASAPLVRSSDGTLWSTIVRVVPGRHLYGFMVDDSLFMLDPRAPKAKDPDFGSEGSVVIVGRP